jgi:hypothetical protein
MSLPHPTPAILLTHNAVLDAIIPHRHLSYEPRPNFILAQPDSALLILSLLPSALDMQIELAGKWTLRQRSHCGAYLTAYLA